MKDVPGELHERPWVDFGHNRTEALNLAKDKADFILFMDADENLVFEKDFALPSLEKDCYYITVYNSLFGGQRTFLINSALDWKWEGAMHEALICSQMKTSEALTNVKVETSSDGNRSRDPKKYLKDAAVLEEMLEKDPTNTRHMFYLAQSYHNAGEFPLAVKNYKKRAAMHGGWNKEIFWSFLAAAKLQQHLKEPAEIFIRDYNKSYESDKTRAEPLFYIADYFHGQENYALSYLITKAALEIPLPNDGMFVESWIYEYGLTLDCANAAAQMGKYEEAKTLYEKVLACKTLPENYQREASSTLELIKTHIHKINKEK